MGGTILFANASAGEGQIFGTGHKKEIVGNRRLNIKDSRGGEVNFNGEKVTYAGKREAGFHASSFALFEKISSLDGNAQNLSEKDVQLAKNLKGKYIDNENFNKVVNIETNSNGQTIFTVKNTAGTTTKLTFDYETDTEKSAREKNEKQQAEVIKKQKETAEKAKKQKEAEYARELHENCKSDLQKAWEWFMGLF